MVDTNLSTKVELYVSASHLVCLDTFSKSDPIAMVYSKATTSVAACCICCTFAVRTGGADWKFLDRTEWQKNTQDPQFKKRFEIEYR
jgi:hypothetical protein